MLSKEGREGVHVEQSGDNGGRENSEEEEG